MDETEYIYAVKEQLRAFDFKEEPNYKNPNNIESCFYKQREGLINTTEETVVITKLEDVEVETVKDTIKTSRSFFQWKVEEGIEATNRRWMYILIVLKSTPGPVGTVINRMAGHFDNGFILPVAASMDSQTLTFDEGNITNHIGPHKNLVSNAKQYFKPITP